MKCLSPTPRLSQIYSLVTVLIISILCSEIRAEDFLMARAGDPSLPVDIKEKLLANFDRVFTKHDISTQGFNNPSLFQEVELNRNAVKIGDYYYSGIQMDLPSNRPITTGFLSFLFPSSTTREDVAGIVLLADVGSIFRPQEKPVNSRRRPDFLIKFPKITKYYSSSFRIEKTSLPNRVAFAFRFRSSKPRKVAINLLLMRHMASRDPATMEKIRSIAFDFPPLLLRSDSAGKGAVQFIGADKNSKKIDGFVVSGFTFELPKNIGYGNLVLMLFQPNGTMVPINQMPEAEIAIYNSPSSREPASPVFNTKRGEKIKVSASSWLKQTYPKVDAYRLLSLHKYSNLALRPGKTHAVVIIKKENESPVTGIAIGFTDAANEDFSNYLPTHLALPLVD